MPRRGGQPDRYGTGGTGAPKLQVRLEPEILAWVKSRPEGARQWIESLAKTQMAAEA